MFQKINHLVSDLWFEKDRIKARDIAINLSNQLLIVMGAQEKKIKNLKDIYNAALPTSYFNNQKIESWFEKHPFFNGPIALKLYDDIDSAFESSFFHLNQTATKARIAATTLLGVNWEDAEIYELPKYKIGIDFFLNYDANSLLLVISKKGNVKVVEFSEKLTHTQIEILTKLSESKGVLAFDGIDLTTGQILPREPQKTIHEVLWRELQVNEVNKKFYIGIASYFDQLTSYLITSKQIDDKKEAQLFSSRLIGRLLFIWFLKKMNLISHDLKYLEFGNLNSSDYYEKKLKPLFFEVLNTPIEDRKFNDLTTPFLNGGLFEPHSNDFYEKRIVFPGDFFSDVFSHLYKFNFTVDESTSEYEQIAIDPEMLGRVFENLLASIVPETANAANERKNKGAFYTPREIVSYMCKESLKESLKTKLNEESLNEGINKLIDLNDANYIELKSSGLANLWGVRSKDIVPKIIDLLNGIKIFDPACGSGAFPIGMLQLISRTYERLNAKYDILQKKHVFGSDKYHYDRYESKLSIIRNNLYGSDIEPMAIEIARLRSWLSLIVEEKHRVYPLPNLDFNFVCSNTLIKLDDNYDIFGGMEFEQELRELSKNYYYTHSKLEKEKLKKLFAKQFSNYYESNSFSESYKQLRTWNPFDSSKPAVFFDHKIMFNVDSFDLIIANPPYYQLQKNKGELNKLYENQKYKCHTKNSDLYVLFFEKSIDILKSKGILCFITSNKWLKTEYGAKLRNYLLIETQITDIVDFSSNNPFESATVDVCITKLIKQQTKNNSKVNYSLVEKNLKSELNQFVKNNAVEIRIDGNLPWTLTDINEDKILTIIRQKGVPLLNWDIEIYKGLMTGYNEAFYITNGVKETIINEDYKSAELIFPLTRGRDISKLVIEKNNKSFVIITDDSIDIDKYPSIKKHLLKFKSELSGRAQVTRGDHKWYSVDNCPSKTLLNYYKKEKIVYPNMTSNPIFSIDKTGSIPNDKTFVIISNKYSKYLFSFLNSTLGYFLLKKYCVNLGEKGLELRKIFINQIPVPPVDSNLQLANELENLADSLYLNYSNPESISMIKSKIDKIIFDFYKLNSTQAEFLKAFKHTDSSTV